MPRLPSPNPVRPGSERRLRDLQQRFRAVSERRGEATLLRQSLRAATVFAALAFVAAVAWVFTSSAWPITTTLRHIVSAPSCGFARWVGLAPAMRGQPGYWKHLDRDGDGIACEPWLSRRGVI
ncbi:excalibur calcium-binding domain-containing protein [Bradyrhizobium sp. USDA 377]